MKLSTKTYLLVACEHDGTQIIFTWLSNLQTDITIWKLLLLKEIRVVLLLFSDDESNFKIKEKRRGKKVKSFLSIM